MTIDELRVRKIELLARKKYELDLQEKGQGDNFNLFMINEELLDVSAKLRALTPSCRVGSNRVTHSAYVQDRQQFLDWLQQDSEEDTDVAKMQMRRILRGGIDSISSRQREILLLWSDGLRGTEIAERLGVDKTTVSRTLKRAKANVKRLTETRLAVEQLRDDNRLDMSDPEVSKLLMSILTVHQAVCFYLYYSERLSIRDVGKLLQVDHSTILRTIQRAVARIRDALGGQIDILDNAEELDNLVFAIYRGLCERGEELPPEVQKCLGRSPSEGYLNHGRLPGGKNLISIRHPEIQIHANIEGYGPGRLLQALQDRYRNLMSDGINNGQGWSNPIVRWLVKVFRTVTKPRKL